MFWQNCQHGAAITDCYLSGIATHSKTNLAYGNNTGNIETDLTATANMVILLETVTYSKNNFV